MLTPLFACTENHLIETLHQLFLLAGTGLVGSVMLSGVIYFLCRKSSVE